MLQSDNCKCQQILHINIRCRVVTGIDTVSMVFDTIFSNQWYQWYFPYHVISRLGFLHVFNKFGEFWTKSGKFWIKTELLKILKKKLNVEISKFCDICNFQFKRILYITFFIEQDKYNKKGYMKNLLNIKLKPLKA